MAHLEGVTGDDLRQILAEVEGKRATQRVMVGLNYKSGLTQRRLATMYGVTEKTIYNWLSRLDRLADEPVEEVVYDADRPGRPPKLTDTEHARLEETLLQSPTQVGYDASAWTPTLAQRYIAETFDVEYCLRQVRTLLTEAGLSYKTVRSENQDADPRAQEAWREGFKKKKYDDLDDEYTVITIDQTRRALAAYLTHGWFRKESARHAMCRARGRV